MGKRSRQICRTQLEESIDPRFCGIFKTIGKEPAAEELLKTNLSFEQRELESHSDQGFCDYLSAKLTEYLDRHIKHVEPSIVDFDLSQFIPEGIRLFSDSDVLTEKQLVCENVSPEKQIIPKSHQSKKRKRERKDEKELLKQVVVTPDWIHQQAKIFNS